MIYYTYRVTEDWENKKDFAYHWTHKYDDFVKNVNFISFWNNTFEIKWFQFRGEVKKISQKHFSILGVKEVPKDDWVNLNDEDFLIFIDDDDMISPNLLGAVANSNAGFVYGDVSFFDLHKNTSSFQKQDNNITSCGYAFKVKYLRKLNSHSLYSVFNEHWNLRKDVMNNNIPSYYHNEICSCYTVDWSSVSQMVRDCIYHRLFDEKCLEYNGPPVNIESYLTWAAPFLTDYSDLIYKTNQSKIKR